MFRKTGRPLCHTAFCLTLLVATQAMALDKDAALLQATVAASAKVSKQEGLRGSAGMGTKNRAANSLEANTFVWESLGLVPVILILLLISRGISHSRGRSTSKDFAVDVAEFFGTFALVFSVGCNVLIGDATLGVIAISSTLMVCIYALGGISGAHFNPAVSMALGILGKMSWSEVASYICNQLAGGLSAGLAYSVMLGDSFDIATARNSTWLSCGFAELLYTFVLVFVVLNVAVAKEHAGQNEYYGVAISLCIVAGGYGAGALSGGCFNPAVAVGIDGPALFFGDSIGLCFVWIVFELLGACLAVGLFHVVRPGDFGREKTIVTSLASEFIGTYVLVLTVGLNILSGSSGAVFSIAASLICMVFALGSVSGAQFNPAVTAAIICSTRDLISTKDAILYVLFQISGALCGALTASMLHGGSNIDLQPVTSLPRALVGEFLFTLLLCYVVLSVATIKSPLTENFGLAIGSCVIAGGLAVGSLSGGSLNPAVTAGLSIKSGTAFHNLGYYACVQILAGFASAALFKVTHWHEYENKAGAATASR